MEFSPAHRIRHALVRSRWKVWLAPACCALPYFLSLIWLLGRDQIWIVQIMITPLLMMMILALLTWWLARLEFRMKPGEARPKPRKIIKKLRFDVLRSLGSLVSR